MFKITPNPPETDEPATRALDFYLKPTPKKETSDNPNTLFFIVPDVDSECLLANLSESLASANAMISDLAFDLEGSRRHVALGSAGASVLCKNRLALHGIGILFLRSAGQAADPCTFLKFLTY